jgi:aspartate ammonia-lyase
VELTIYRKSVKKQINKNKTRCYSFKSVDVAVLLNDSTGYIKSIVLQKQPLKNLKGLTKLKKRWNICDRSSIMEVGIWKKQSTLQMNC